MNLGIEGARFLKSFILRYCVGVGGKLVVSILQFNEPLDMNRHPSYVPYFEKTILSVPCLDHGKRSCINDGSES
jgi:hypothetical protein